MPIELKNKTSSTITEDTYEFMVDGKYICYKEFLNDKGKVIDVTLRDENGHDLSDADLQSTLQVFIDEQELLRKEKDEH